IVGEPHAGHDGKRRGDRKVGDVERDVEIFDLPGYARIRHSALDTPARRPARLDGRAVERCSRREGTKAELELAQCGSRDVWHRRADATLGKAASDIQHCSWPDGVTNPATHRAEPIQRVIMRIQIRCGEHEKNEARKETLAERSAARVLS